MSLASTVGLDPTALTMRDLRVRATVEALLIAARRRAYRFYIKPLVEREQLKQSAKR